MDVDRGRALDELAGRRFDLLVVGGGVTGAGVAWEAARLGLSVALVDRGDFGSATSSASSKLIHGGLRYLRLGDVGLVREAHHERRLLMRVVAPHLVRRLPFLFPLYEDGPYRPWFVQSGIVVYSTLARARLNGIVELERAQKLVPPLRERGLRSCALYEDAWTNDGRLTLANLRVSFGWQANAKVVHRSAGGGKVDLARLPTSVGEPTFARRLLPPIARASRFVVQFRAAVARAVQARESFRAPSPRGKAEVCKTSTPGSNPGGASNLRGCYRRRLPAMAFDVSRAPFSRANATQPNTSARPRPVRCASAAVAIPRN